VAVGQRQQDMELLGVSGRKRRGSSMIASYQDASSLDAIAEPMVVRGKLCRRKQMSLTIDRGAAAATK